MSHTLKKRKSAVVSKHDVLAHLLQFVNYCEDFLATPKPMRHMLDMSVLRNKCKQCKEVIRQAGGDL